MRNRITLAIAISLLGSPALAQTTFESLDTNSDGSISKDEYYGLVSDAGIYPDLDSDSDGLIEENEFEGIGLDDDYASWDLNRDDYVDSREFYDGYFGYYDANEDAHWDGDEWDDADEAGILDF
jgi:hypothetical protein